MASQSHKSSVDILVTEFAANSTSADMVQAQRRAEQFFSLLLPPLPCLNCFRKRSEPKRSFSPFMPRFQTRTELLPRVGPSV